MVKKVQDSSLRYQNVPFMVLNQMYRFDVRNLKSKQALFLYMSATLIFKHYILMWIKMVIIKAPKCMIKAQS